MTVEVVRVTPAELGILYTGKVDFPVIAYVGLEDGRIVASGGLCWYGGRCWLWLDNVDMSKPHPIYVTRWARRMLATAVQLGEREVWAQRDPEPMAERLLTHLGFVIEGDGEVELWKWQDLRQSPPSSPPELP